ncbi:STAS domain-containing protein [Zobellia amurskyensis]|uniref:STAS domain-containing protein n=1 Tax=Zobellia amurskyensis TaxID=248905 RepID=A0A7X2ZW72_9FLAO|nr:STAS domain-containing protein [Zobellia amurskyensis]MUH37479.1 STAS domain-containing protein [Zobellia amurskyensis]
MPLQITEARGIFCVHGTLNSKSANILIRHIGGYLGSDRRVVINLERLKSIDVNGASALRQLYDYAVKKNRQITILGKANENVLSSFRKINSTYILGGN